MKYKPTICDQSMLIRNNNCRQYNKYVFGQGIHVSTDNQSYPSEKRKKTQILVSHHTQVRGQSYQNSNCTLKLKDAGNCFVDGNVPMREYA